MRMFPKVPEELLLQYCQGTAKQYNGGAGNTTNRAPVATSGYLQLDILNGGFLVNTNAHNGDGGYLHEPQDGTKRIFQEMSVSPIRDGTIVRYDVAMPVTNETINIHQVVLATGHYYGISANHECHVRQGGILDGIVGHGETIADKFSCTVKCPSANSLIAQGLVADPSQRCDGDHLFGRDTKYMNGLWMVQAVSHRENITRSWVRIKWGEWLFPIYIGKYIDGNTTLKKIRRRS